MPNIYQLLLPTDSHPMNDRMLLRRGKVLPIKGLTISYKVTATTKLSKVISTLFVGIDFTYLLFILFYRFIYTIPRVE